MSSLPTGEGGSRASPGSWSGAWATREPGPQRTQPRSPPSSPPKAPRGGSASWCSSTSSGSPGTDQAPGRTEGRSDIPVHPYPHYDRHDPAQARAVERLAGVPRGTHAAAIAHREHAKKLTGHDEFKHWHHAQGTPVAALNEFLERGWGRATPLARLIATLVGDPDQGRTRDPEEAEALLKAQGVPPHHRTLIHQAGIGVAWKQLTRPRTNTPRATATRAEAEPRRHYEQAPATAQRLGSGTGRDGMVRDGMVRDGMGWDGMGWDRPGWVAPAARPKATATTARLQTRIT